ncbi:MAG: hypothetical protein M3Q70_02470 [bacterium]|nr:hypothetical protein [bacterium]
MEQIDGRIFLDESDLKQLAVAEGFHPGVGSRLLNTAGRHSAYSAERDQTARRGNTYDNRQVALDYIAMLAAKENIACVQGFGEVTHKLAKLAVEHFSQTSVTA